MRKCGKILHSWSGRSWQYGACALHAGCLRLQKHTHTQHARNTMKATQCFIGRNIRLFSLLMYAVPHLIRTYQFQITVLLASRFESPRSQQWTVSCRYSGWQYLQVAATSSMNRFMSLFWLTVFAGGCYIIRGHAVAQLVEALLYKPEGHGFDSRWCHWNI
jgi:hypothetical protein